MSWAPALGLDGDELVDHRAFLLDRAAVHAEASAKTRDPARNIFAATLWRDAGALSVLMRDYGTAARLLADAAEAYLSEDVPYGLLLDAILGGSPSWTERRTLLDKLSMQLGNSTSYEYPTGGEGEGWRTRSGIGNGAPIDVVRVYQAMVASRIRRASVHGTEGDVESELFDPVSEAAYRRVGSGRPTGPSPLNFAALRAMAPTRGAPAFGEVSFPNRLLAVAAERELALEAARRDAFNWALLPNPADVVDFDLVLLISLAMDIGFDDVFLVRTFGSADDPTSLPIEAAWAFRRSVDVP